MNQPASISGKFLIHVIQLHQPTACRKVCIAPVEAQPRRVRMIPATIRATLTTTSPVTAPPKIAIDIRNPPIGVNDKDLARDCN